MNRLLLVITVLLSLSAVALFALRQPPARPEADTGAAAPAAASPEVRPETAGADPASVPTAAPTTEASATPTAAGTAADTPVDAADQEGAAIRAEAERHRPYASRRLGWDRNDPRLQFVAEWLVEKWSAEMQAIDDIDSMADRDKPAAMRAWNDATDARRIALVQNLGVEGARQVSEQWCLYRFDVDAKGWYRIDVTGERVPFQNEDDSIWSNGELNTRSWENHR